MSLSARAVVGSAVAVLAAVAGFWLLTAPVTWRLLRGTTEVASTAGDAQRGRILFDVGGCASCHVTPGSQEREKLGGGMALHTAFGTFVVPNLSPHPSDGIGGWSTADFVRAMREGVSPDGRHYYPSFPYTSYQRLETADLADLFAYLKTLPPVAGRASDHDLAFPYAFRSGLGLWKLAFLDGRVFSPDAGRPPEWNRGAYLVEGAGHCAECHSPRNAFGAISGDRRFAGGPDPEGKGGRVPNLTPHADGLGKWTRDDIAELLKTGFTPDFDSFGGSMAAVVKNTARLTDEDRLAMAAYLTSLPARPGKGR